MKKISKGSVERTSIPLVMIEGNMDVLLNNTVFVNGISLRMIDHPEQDGQAVVLVVHGLNKEHAKEIGFQSHSAEEIR